MRRLLAFMFDTAWMAVAITLFWYIGEQLLQIRIPYTVFSAVGATALFSIIEHTYHGQTPGRFLLRIQLKTESLEHPEAHQIVGRASLLTVSGVGLTLVLDIAEYTLFTPGIVSYMPHYSAIAIGALVLIPMGFTQGQQGFHDYVFRTVVVPTSCAHTYRISREGILSSILIVTIGAVLYGAFIRATVSRFVDGNDAGLYLATGFDSPRDFYEWIPPASLINDGVSHPERFYVRHGFVGLRGKWSIDIDWPPESREPSRSVAFYRINLTWAGLLNQWYQREAIDNLVHFTNDKKNGIPVLVEFVWVVDVLDLVRADFRQQVVAMPFPSTDADDDLSVGSVIPKDGSSMTIHFALGARFPDWISP